MVIPLFFNWKHNILTEQDSSIQRIIPFINHFKNHFLVLALRLSYNVPCSALKVQLFKKCVWAYPFVSENLRQTQIQYCRHQISHKSRCVTVKFTKKIFRKIRSLVLSYVIVRERTLPIKERNKNWKSGRDIEIATKKRKSEGKRKKMVVDV